MDQVAIVLFALAAVAAADYGYGKMHVDYTHVPYYNFEWESLGEGKGYGYGGDSYGEVLRYGQKETRNKDNTETSWWTELPGKSYIKRNDQIHAQQRVSYTKDSYKGNDYKMSNYKMSNYRKY